MAPHAAFAEHIGQYFPGIGTLQVGLLIRYVELLLGWNTRINLVSRKDTNQVWVHHLLHGMAPALFFQPKPGTTFLDVGSGGGIPGIPQAILFPGAHYTLCDSIRKKTNALQDMVDDLGLENVRVHHGRVEDMKEQFHFICGRAVTRVSELRRLTAGRYTCNGINALENGILYLTGEDQLEALSSLKGQKAAFRLSEQLPHPYFSTKVLLYLSSCAPR